uniref:Uncharacterized protein n=1 Tax=Oryza glumipatula TaxID=40148 RepID=A0A0D9YIA1_9ORYZ
MCIRMLTTRKMSEECKEQTHAWGRGGVSGGPGGVCRVLRRRLAEDGGHRRDHRLLPRRSPCKRGDRDGGEGSGHRRDDRVRHREGEEEGRRRGAGARPDHHVSRCLE